ncbi:hypothetical protein FJTKL_11036 [Diaporthe vaccinii]|uniref:protein-ribulosamine 3-kinase n=1 Tax=Diaporthe vaccinii TaxID=105482 RepID=A0ABR4EIH9_9PEZI
MEGEFNSLQYMHAYIPKSCPKPFGWGECETSPGTFFLIMEFINIIAEHPDPEDISRVIANLHKRSAGTSPDFKFGFPAPNCHGKIVQPNGWGGDWSRVLGRRVLQSCLVHGDLWHENIGLGEDVGDGDEENDGQQPVVVYDASMFYGHNDCEVGTWRTVFVAFDESYRKQYMLHSPPSEPAEEWDGRNRLYSIPFNITHSAGWLGAVETTRPRMLEDMHFLIYKYGPEGSPL